MAIPLMSDALIHHDGSSLYVPEQRPKLGQKIKVRIRIHETLGEIRQVLIRQSDSGEAFVGEKLKVFAKRHGWSWYEGSITIHNPQVHYRFFIELKNNFAQFKDASELGRVEMIQADAITYGEKLPTDSVDITFIDPPFSNESLFLSALTQAVRFTRKEIQSAIYVEHPKTVFPENLLAEIPKYGDLWMVGRTIRAGVANGTLLVPKKI